MYPRSHNQFNSYFYPPQNIRGGFHYPSSYPQARSIDHGFLLSTQVPSGQRYHPPPLTHLSEQPNGYNYTTPVEDRPSCMHQESCRPDLSCTRGELEDHSEENDGDSVEDCAEGNKMATITRDLTSTSQFLEQ